MLSMDPHEWLAQRFEENRGHLRGVAYRMLGSLTEADDAIQETWLRLSRSDANAIENLGGWLTTVVARVCLDMLRSRTSRREEAVGAHVPEPAANTDVSANPEQEALLADSVGLALLVVLERLTPAERLAFVLHDIFAISFDEIGTIVGRSPTAARQLASRARRRVHGPAEVHDANLNGQRKLVDAFIGALRRGDVEALVELLDPEFVVHADHAAGVPTEVRGARNWASQAVKAARGAVVARPALVNGSVGVVIAPGGRLFRALLFTIADEKIVKIDVVADPQRLAELDLAVLNE